MKCCRTLILVVCVALIGFNGFIVYSAEQNKKSNEFRNEFVKNFRRTGLNTTVGDAMMLRILVESSGARRGIEVGSASGFGAINMGIGFQRAGGALFSVVMRQRRA